MYLIYLRATIAVPRETVTLLSRILSYRGDVPGGGGFGGVGGRGDMCGWGWHPPSLIVVRSKCNRQKIQKCNLTKLYEYMCNLGDLVQFSTWILDSFRAKFVSL